MQGPGDWLTGSPNLYLTAHILSAPDVETESEVGDAVQPVTTTREGKS